MFCKMSSRTKKMEADVCAVIAACEADPACPFTSKLVPTGQQNVCLLLVAVADI